MKKKLMLNLFLAFSLMFLASCTSGEGKDGNNSNGLEMGLDRAMFLAKLSDKGASIENQEAVAYEFFSVEGMNVNVNGKRITIFEYPSVKAAEMDSSAITDGFEFEAKNGVRMMVDWIDMPHFYREGKIIVLYVGRDQKTLSLLEEILGKRVNTQQPLNEENQTKKASEAIINTQAGYLTLRYRDGKAELSGTLQRSTPCVNWQVKSIVMESYPEQVRFEIYDASTSQMCVQMLGEPQAISSSVGVSADASYKVYFEDELVFEDG